MIKKNLLFAEISYWWDRRLIKTLRKTVFLPTLILLLRRESVLPFESASYADLGEVILKNCFALSIYLLVTKGSFWVLKPSLMHEKS